MDSRNTEATAGNSCHQDYYEDDIVISGVSCRFPESDNMAEFWENLISGKDMVTEGDGSRWRPGFLGLPTRNGWIRTMDKFDADFFGVPPKQAENANPLVRNLLEVAYEAIVDAGVSPLKIRGSKTGVFIGSQQPDTDPIENKIPAYTLTGGAMSMTANRLSYYFDFKGPSLVVDTACSATFHALHLAIMNIRSGNIDAALVGGSMTMTDPNSSHMFMKLGVLSPEGKCRSFDKDANGYVRSEGISAFYIQKRADARRLYCTVVGTKINSDGYKVEGVTFPSSEVQAALLRSVYKETGVNPAEDIAYFEAHATGTPAGDSQECAAITSVLCEGRVKPLLIGSVKSNMGHCEAASGGASLAKVILAMETNIIPANINFSAPMDHVPGLNNGQLQVVSKNTEWKGGLVGVNSFGFGGANAHAILRSHNVEKHENDGCRKARLVLYGGRTSEGVECILKEAQKHSTDLSFHRLLSETANMPISTYPYRGFTIVNSDESKTDVKKSTEEGRPVWFVFAGMGSQWQGMGRSMMNIDTFKNSILKSDAILKQHGVSLYDMIMKGDDVAEDIIKSFIGITAIQVALVDVLQCIGVEPDGIVGHSVGELACGYADGSLTAEEAVLAAYWRGYCVKNAGLPAGAMAAVGLTWEEAQKMCPQDIVPACHNAKESVTISGPEEAVKSFVKELEGRGTFARMVKSAGVAFHSYFMKEVEEPLRKALKKVIVPKPRTSTWISSSYPESQWSAKAAKISSAEYHVHNLVSPVLFHECLKHVPKNAVVIEIAPHALLQSLLKGSLNADCCIVGLMKRNTENNVDICMNALGKCYQHGVNIDVLSLFPTVPLPVPRGTPMISSLLKWDHSQKWAVPRTEEDEKLNESYTARLDLSTSEYRHLLEHRVDGRSVMPGSGYLVIAWQALAERENKQWYNMPVCFEDITYNRATFLTPDSTIKLEVRFVAGSDKFQVLEQKDVVIEGKIRIPDDKTLNSVFSDPWCSKVDHGLDYEMDTEDIYKEIRLKGYEYGPNYRMMTKSVADGTNGKIKWTGDWIMFLDGVTHLTIFFVDGLVMPTRIASILIDPKFHYQYAQKAAESGYEDLPVFHDMDTEIRRSGGVCFQDIVAPYIRHTETKPPIHEMFTFVPNVNSIMKESNARLARYAQLCEEKVLETLKRGTNLSGNMDYLDPRKLLQANANTRISVQNVSPAFDDAFTDDQAHSLLKVLDEINKKVNDEFTSEFLKELVSKKADELLSDVLLSNLLQPKFVKPLLQVVMENTHQLQLKQLEIFKHELIDSIDTVFETIPGNRPQSYIATMDPALEEGLLQGGRITDTVKWTLGGTAPASVGKFSLVLANHALRKQTNISKALQSIAEMLEEGGFMIMQEVTTRFHLTSLIDDANIDGKQVFEDIDDRTCGIYCDTAKWREILHTEGFEIINEVSDGILSSLFLVRKVYDNVVENQTFLDISNLSCDWLDQLQHHLKSVSRRPKGENLWLRADDSTSGIIGLVNTLRQEPGGEKLRYIFNMNDSALNQDESTLERLVKRDLVANVYKNGQWGSYRHLPMEKAELVQSQHAYVNTGKMGVLSSLAWYESPLKHDQKANPGVQDICDVHYASLNFRDVMLATGKLIMDSIPGYENNKDCMLGMEFSGTDGTGRRVMGMTQARGLATTIKVDRKLVWPVPENWTLEEAATVPVAYTTAYYALVIRGNISPRNSVLIHSGSGGVGQAAITIALHYGCKVFTTVGTVEKRKFLKDRFPDLKDENIFSSRDTVFEKEIKKLTKSKGVDLVLNSLADEKLFASVRVLAKHGKFLEIGKYDLSKNSQLGMTVFLKNISFHGILTDALFDAENGELEAVSRCLSDGIKSGVVKPLDTTVFGTDEVEDAFRFMAKGKHIGKILIKIRGNSDIPSIPAIPRTSFNPDKSYIITGGLGGFGLELAGWMFSRGARHLILTSRSGVKTGYQKRKLRIWEWFGFDVIISTKNICDKEEVRQMFQQAGRPVGGVFHLAMVLQDSMLENQTVEKFQAVCTPKVKGTMVLDEVTREQPFADTLDWFVGFSSTASGYGNVGQSNYSFANSALERIIEHRRDDGLPGLAIQWGPIGDVGVFIDQVGDNNTVLGGTIPQRMISCLQSLDVFLNQPGTVTCSYVLADQKISGTKTGNKSIGNAVLAIIGIKDSSSVDENKTLVDLGMDSLMGVEIKLFLENEHGLSLSAKEIRDLTTKKLKLIENTEDDADKKELVKTESDLPWEIIPTEIVVKLNEVNTGTPLFIIHSLYGLVDGFGHLAARLNIPVYGIQRTAEVPQDSIEDVAKFYIQVIESTYGKGPIYLAGYSFGTVIAQEMALQCQSTGQYVKCLILLDGTSEWMKKNLEDYMSPYSGMQDSIKNEKTQLKEGHQETDKNLDYGALFGAHHLKLPIAEALGGDLKIADMTEEYFASRLLSLNPQILEEDAKLSYAITMRSVHMGIKYTPDYMYKGDTLLVATEDSMNFPLSTPDYDLHKFCSGKLSVEVIPGRHIDMLLKDDSVIDIADIINSQISSM